MTRVIDFRVTLPLSEYAPDTHVGAGEAGYLGNYERVYTGGFGAYAGWFLSNYQPLTGGSGFYGVSAHGAHELRDLTSPEGDTFDEWKIPFAPGGTASYTFTPGP